MRSHLYYLAMTLVIAPQALAVTLPSDEIVGPGNDTAALDKRAGCISVRLSTYLVTTILSVGLISAELLALDQR